MVELATGVAGTVAGMLLCDNGARVVKVEPPEGSPERAQAGHLVWNRGKESLTVDASDPTRLAELRRLLVRADVLIDDYPPDAASELRLDRPALVAANPRLITCSITGYGPQGPLAQLAPRDALICARFGLAWNQPGWLPGPSHIVHRIPSIGAALLAAQGVTAALLSRAATGRGQHVGTSLLAGVLAMSTEVQAERLPERPSISRDARGTIPFYGAYECADGKWLQFGCVDPGFVERAIAAIGIAERVRDPRFGDCYVPTGQVVDELFAIIESAIRTRSFAEWAGILEAADVPFAAVQTTEEFIDDPQARTNGIIRLEDPEVGLIDQIGLPVRLSETPGRVRIPAPRLGQHTAAILSEISEGASRGANRRRGGASDPPGHGSGQPPLKGLHVLELASLISGPMAGRFLADLGADVVKLEPPQGEIGRRYREPAFLPLNSGKRSIVVNLKSVEGQVIGTQLASWADVLIDNMRPGVTERLGLGWERLRRVNPRLIYCHVTGYGSRGPYSQRAGVDPLAAALTGMELAQGGYRGRPVHLLCYSADHTAALLGCEGILLALFARTRTGQGQRVETSLLDAGALLSSHALTRYAGRPPRNDLAQSQFGLHALQRLYHTRQGWLYLAVETDDQWQALCWAIGREWLRSDRRFANVESRSANDEALSRELGEALNRRRADEWTALFEAASVPCVPAVEDYAQTFYLDPQVAACGMIVEHRHPENGVIKLLHRWFQLSEARVQCTAPPPLLGQHTRDVLAELGYAELAIAELQKQGVVLSVGSG